MEPELGPGLRTRDKKGQAEERKAGLQLSGQWEGLSAVLRVAIRCLNLLPWATGFTPHLSNKMASLSTGKNLKETAVVSSLEFNNAFMGGTL